MGMTPALTVPAARWVRILPVVLTLIAGTLLLVHGPIAQPTHYNDFADRRGLLGIANAANVLSNVGFAVIGLWGWIALRSKRDHPGLAASWPGYRLFFLALAFTAVGSGFYHLAPSDGRLIWDRLPIALACAGLLAAVRSDTKGGNGVWIWGLSLAAIVSVWWWYASGQTGIGDLRPYLLLQGLPLLLIPLWQTIYHSPPRERLAFGLACGIYVAAKVAEVYDHQLFAALGISGHTIKHLLATAGPAIISHQLTQRVARVPPGVARKTYPG